MAGWDGGLAENRKAANGGSLSHRMGEGQGEGEQKTKSGWTGNGKREPMEQTQI
jgi:hypothetical protein